MEVIKLSAVFFAIQTSITETLSVIVTVSMITIRLLCSACTYPKLKVQVYIFIVVFGKSACRLQNSDVLNPLLAKIKCASERARYSRAMRNMGLMDYNSILNTHTSQARISVCTCVCVCVCMVICMCATSYRFIIFRYMCLLL
jgi:hypothetical protein